MDSSIDLDTSALSHLSAKDKAELQQFISNESQKIRIQQAVHTMTEMCWKKCFSSTSMKSNNPTSGEEDCTKNCVGRFLDGNERIIRELEKFKSERH